MHMTFEPAKVLGELWQNILEKRREARERKRIEHADKIRHALTVLKIFAKLGLRERQKPGLEAAPAFKAGGGHSLLPGGNQSC